MTKLDEISVEEVAGVIDLLRASVNAGDRYFTIKGHDDMRRVLIALNEWLPGAVLARPSTDLPF